uniref:ABC transporter domain-containing protein n=1 Tax=Ananas comosus var. bracteatus TaxID=296719 RepID=A0A6V7QJH5_ANACO|nr:unnamed protein product [Ananas comosus var. bracteatus]
MWAPTEPAFSRSSSYRECSGVEEEEEALRRAAIERLPTFARARRGLLRRGDDSPGAFSEVDVAALSSEDRTALVDRLLSDTGDAGQFFSRIRRRFDAVNLEFPKIEVRFQDLKVGAYVHVGSRALPTIPNFICNMTEAFLRYLRIFPGRRIKLPILDNISGIIQPSRLTLLLGPPSSGKTTLLLALAGRLSSGLQMSGNITYNGHSLKEFVPQRTSAYVSQQDWHASEMTVRETLEFAGRSQGVGIKYDMLTELLRREKNAGIKPDEDLDIFMKALALEGKQTNLVAEYIMKGWISVPDTRVGDEMIKGISGGQKKRLTTGELLVGPARVLFMDEISTGLDSSTTYHIIKYLKHSTQALDGTTIISLLQPAPETYELFDDVILISEGQIVYQGPRDAAVDYFAGMGFRCPEHSIPVWWIWGYWISPLMYAQNAISINEFLGHSWDKKVGKNGTPLGEVVLKGYGLFSESYWYWIGVGALFAYTVILNILFTLFLTYLNPLGRQQAVVSKDEIRQRDQKRKRERIAVELRSYLRSDSLTGTNLKEKKGMVLPFQPLSMCFQDINYYVDVPVELKKQGIVEDQLQLLVNVTGAFRPGVLTALVGVSGAGKTTLMDVLAGRKTGGLIEGSITISGYPKNQETFARISGYCEQNDVHSPCVTVIEALLFSAWLRLPSHVDLETRRVFVEEVMELVELNRLSGALVGLPGVNGLSTEQRKRLTIAVELVANPSIVFMDEPTSGLDARAAAIVMRTLLFMKRGGELIYAGPLGPKSRKLIDFFEAIPGVPKIKDGYNPAAWMLEVTNPMMENSLGVDFADYYRQSKLFRQNREMVENLSKPNSDSKELSFPTKYAQPFFSQYLACLWKQNLSYWRNPQYTAVRFFYTVVISVMFGTICWQFGSKRATQQDIFNAMGSMYAAVLFVGITNATAVQPVVSIERFVSYRERVCVEFPYVLVQTLFYGTIFYSLGSFEWTMTKFLWYIFFMYFTLLYFTFFGMMTIAITPNQSVAPIIAAPFYTLWNLFSGFLITRKRIPVWWRWYYWADPISWTLYGLLTSQFGDIEKPMKLSDGNHSANISTFLRFTLDIA